MTQEVLGVALARVESDERMAQMLWKSALNLLSTEPRALGPLRSVSGGLGPPVRPTKVFLVFY